MIKNFLFHRVSPNRDLLWDPMSVELFEKCIKFIKNNYDVIVFEDLIEQPDLYREKRLVTIMFDDGYKDNLEFAFPILEKYKVKASFYVVTNCIENNALTWTHILEYFFINTYQKRIDLDFDFLPEKLKVNYLNNKSERLEYIIHLKPLLKKMPNENVRIVINQILKSFNDVEMPKLMMSWSDLNILKDNGHQIGSHSMTHSMLGNISNMLEVENELQESFDIIKKRIRVTPKVISYPIGSYNNEVKEIAKKVGYKAGLAVKQSKYNPIEDDLFEVPRIELYNETWIKTRMRINGNLELVKKIIRY